ncbi:MAG: hydroxyacid dehydrogenase [Armatimonadetes bacterium]|nr:hydroxyacid dehydrogenase [Armatimonadota bacterium]
MIKPSVFVVPAGKLQTQLFPEQVRERLEHVAEPIYNEREDLTPTDLATALQDRQVVITSWGSPQLTPELLDSAHRLALVAHAAGSVRSLLPEPPSDFFRRGIRITSATPTMSPYVAEHALCLAIACLRRLSAFREEMKGSDLWWGTYSDLAPETLIGRRVGLVGLGRISWELVRLLQPFKCEIAAYSRHADPEVASTRGVSLMGLDELLSSCHIVFTLAAVRPDTVKMIDRKRLASLPDGAVIVNVARGALIDEDALVDELRSGRIWAGLDVTEPEPPAADSPLRALPNVLLSPHVGGPVPSRYWEMAEFVVEEIARFAAGEPLEAEITEKRLAGMA